MFRSFSSAVYEKCGVSTPRHRGTQLPMLLCVDNRPASVFVVPRKKYLDLTSIMHQSKFVQVRVRKGISGTHNLFPPVLLKNACFLFFFVFCF